MFGNAPSVPEPDSKFYRHPAKPEWGRGVLIAERDGKLILQWEDGAEHAVATAFRDRLEVFALPKAEALEVSDRVRGHRSRRIKAQERDKAKAIRMKKSPPPPRATFDEQLRRFAGSYPGGFTDSEYVVTERGPQTGGIAVSRDAAMARAREVLSDAALAADGAFEAVQTFLAETKLLHPVEGAVRFRSLAPEHRADLIAALRAVLHGTGDYAPRFDAYVTAFKFTDAGGEIVRPTWPLTTVFQALLDPVAHVLVKPKLLQEQAAVLNLPVNYQPLPSGAVYEELRAVLRAVSERLRAAGHAPRDLIDVAAFVTTTLGPKAVALAAATIAAAAEAAAEPEPEAEQAAHPE